MLGFGEKKYSDDVIRSAHDKQKKKFQGQGGIIFTKEEQEVIDNHIELPAPEDNDDGA